jgi:hypothetical protein
MRSRLKKRHAQSFAGGRVCGHDTGSRSAVDHQIRRRFRLGSVQRACQDDPCEDPMNDNALRIQR